MGDYTRHNFDNSNKGTIEERTLTRLNAVNHLINFYKKMTADYPEDFDDLNDFKSLIKMTEMVLEEYRDVITEVYLKNKDYENDKD